MSNWSHINCSIRVDSFPYMEKVLPPNESNMPEGREGGLSVSVWENSSESSIASHTINIFGDLRDYNNDVELQMWFTSILTTEYDFWRSAIMEINNESNDYLIILVGQKHDNKVAISREDVTKIEGL